MELLYRGFEKEVRFCFFEKTVFIGDSRIYAKEDIGSWHLSQ